MAKVGIIGAGLVGAAAGYLLAGTPGVSELVLVDSNRARAASEAADITHASAFTSSAVIREGEIRDLAEADVVVITAGSSLQPGQTRLDLARVNVGVVASILPEVLRWAPDAVLLFATNPVDVMPALAVRHFGVPAGRAIGTGCALDSARFRARLASHLGIAPAAVHASVLGEHGDSEVLHWSGARVAGMALGQFAEACGRPIPPALQATIDEEVRRSAYRIKEGKGVSNFGIGGCIARLTRAIIHDERLLFSISTFQPRILGVEETCISLPHMLGRNGASDAYVPPLDNGEETALRNSATILQEAIAAGLGSV